jgi:hypothetical protein
VPLFDAVINGRTPARRSGAPSPLNAGGGPTDDKPAVTLETPRDPDRHLIEVGQTTDPEGDWSPTQWPSTTSGGESE